MIEEIQFKNHSDDPNYEAPKVCVQIDNQRINDLEIKEIIRFPTNIIMLSQIDAILYNLIDINMLLVVPNDEEDSLEYKGVVEKGFVNISITNLNKNITYDSQRLSFKDGVIQMTMTDKLGIGDYLLTIDYAGNRYYEATQLSLQFSVIKRKAECQFHDNVVGGYPEEKMSVPISFFDALNGKTINNCIVNYSFNNISYVTHTDSHGYANLTFSMPKVTGDACAMNIITNDETVIAKNITDDDVNVYWTIDGTLIPYSVDNELILTQFVNDDDGDENIEEEIQTPISDDNDYEEDDEIEEETTKYNVYVYELIINIDSKSYQMEDQVIYLGVNKFDTHIMAYFTTDDDTQKLIVEGDVLNYNNRTTSNVEYGIIELFISDIDYHKQVMIDEYGHFIIEMPYTDIHKSVSNNVAHYNAQLYSVERMTKISIDEEENLSFVPGQTISFTAMVIDNYTKQPISEGMVTYIIKRNNKEVYRYVTEVTDIGEAYMSFDVSTIGDYTVQAFYHPIFNLLGSESQIIEYKVEEE